MFMSQLIYCLTSFYKAPQFRFDRLDSYRDPEPNGRDISCETSVYNSLFPVHLAALSDKLNKCHHLGDHEQPWGNNHSDFS